MTTFLHLLSEYIGPNDTVRESSPQYIYEGRCPHSNEHLQLPRTTLSEAVAYALMEQLHLRDEFNIEGKMYGVLIAEAPTGERYVLQAFSGQLQGQSTVEGWVPPLPGKERFALEESRVLHTLDEHKKELQRLYELPERAALQALDAERQTARTALQTQHKQNKKRRKALRAQFESELSDEALHNAFIQLNAESQEESYQRRKLKRDWDERCAALEAIVKEADRRMLALRHARKRISRELQANMHAAYEVMNFTGDVSSLNALFEDGRLPSGTGDCCAPKLLHYAASQQLRPIGLAEFWWGPPTPNGTKEHKQFYGACEERCQPIMGFLLSGLTHLPRVAPISGTLSLDVLYEDDDLLIINKPSGLASVPGRTFEHYDSVASRARHLYPELPSHVAVHRLDLETSGILVLAKHTEAYLKMSEAFRKRMIHKQYEAILDGTLSQIEGEIHLSLAPDPKRLPRQKVDPIQGKPSHTQYKVIAYEQGRTRIAFVPITGRTHQLRMHAMAQEGLGLPIVGDSLYHPNPQGRLRLHACEIRFVHPFTQQDVHILSTPPF